MGFGRSLVVIVNRSVTWRTPAAVRFGGHNGKSHDLCDEAKLEPQLNYGYGYRYITFTI